MSEYDNLFSFAGEHYRKVVPEYYEGKGTSKSSSKKSTVNKYKEIAMHYSLNFEEFKRYGDLEEELLNNCNVNDEVLSQSIHTNIEMELLGSVSEYDSSSESNIKLTAENIDLCNFFSMKLREQQQKRENYRYNLFQSHYLYVKNIDGEISDEEFLKLFSEYGTVSKAKIMRDANTGISEGFGYVCYNLPEDVQKSIAALNGTRIRSKPLDVTQALTQLPQQFPGLDSILYVKNIDGEISDEEFLKLFSEYGTVSKALIMRDANTGISKGFGLVYYNLPEDAQKSIAALNGTRIRSKPLVVTLLQRTKVLNHNTNELPPNQKYKRVPSNNAGPQHTNIGIRPGAGVMPLPNQPDRGARYQRQTPRRGLSGQARTQPPQQFPGLDFSIIPLEKQKNLIGEQLYPLVRYQDSARALKITAMLLEMEITELIYLLENTHALQRKVKDSAIILKQLERLKD
eukprot:gene26369-34501_t